MRVIAALCFAFCASPAFAVCTRPAPPAIPDGTTASDAAMSATPDRMDAYLRAMNAHFDCLEAEDRAAHRAAEDSLAQWEKAKADFAARR